MEIDRLAELSPTTADAEKVATVLETIKQRMLRAEVPDVAGVTSEDLERVALDLRVALESVVLLSFASHRPLWESAGATLGKESVDDARKKVRRLNPGYWPQPVYEEPPETLVDLEEGFLRESEWGRAIGTTSSLLHAQNPFTARDLMRDATAIQAVSRKLRALTNLFIVDLADTGVGLLCNVDYGARDSSPDIRVMINQQKWPEFATKAMRFMDDAS